MKCKFCKEIMEQFTESFIVCPNQNCLHRQLDAKDREGAKTRSYCIRGKE